MYSKISVALLLFITVAHSSVVPKKKSTADLDSFQMGNEFSVLQKVYDDCHNNDDFTGCLKGKALNAIVRAVDQV